MVNPATHLVGSFFFELVAILATCRLIGLLARKLGQPQVIGEMIAGILLGPSLLGWLAPSLQGNIFPQQTKPILEVISQLGVVLYMFTVGLEFDVRHIRRRMRSAMSISLAGIAVPLVLGGLLGAAIYSNTQLFPAGLPFVTAILFLGTAMSVTAFPVLSRIIQERGLITSPLGTLVLAAGSIDDAIAWCLLALVLATVNGIPSSALLAVGGGICYVVLVLGLRRVVFQRLADAADKAKHVSEGLLSSVLILLLLGACFTDMVGVHAVFGAFIFGAMLPRGQLTRAVRTMVEPVTLSLLLPLFFTFSGLNTNLSLVSTPALWGLTILVVVVACLGKGVACWAAARASGSDQQEALGIGALMNTRGLMELIMLNIALSRGIIGPTLFSIMIVMTILTTVMATPLFNHFYTYKPEHPIPLVESVKVGPSHQT